jgi:hypothetical protein
VHTFIQSNVEIKLGRFTTLPDITLVLLNHLSVNVDDSTVTKVSRCLERIGSTILTTWEGNFVVISDVTFASATKFLITDLFHGLDLFFTISFLGLEFDLLLDHIKVLNSVLVELECFDEDG